MQLSLIGILVCLSTLTGEKTERDLGPLVSALWLVHDRGTPEAVSIVKDQTVKATLYAALQGDQTLSFEELDNLFDRATFRSIAGEDDRIDFNELEQTVQEAAPASRADLFDEIRQHAEYLTTSFDLIDELHREAGSELIDWIVANYTEGEPLHVTAVCTGNSRRSMMTATWGNIAATYYGFPEIRFHSGGTDPSAFNRRTITTLEAIGVVVGPTDREAERGEAGNPNPIYRVQWGTQPTYESIEFSKRYDDAANPQSGFAALMVCSEADAECPFVPGADRRISMPYLDPKLYDNTSFEGLKYAERRDDIGRLMLSVMMQVKNRLGSISE